MTQLALYSGRYLVMTTSKDTARSNLMWIADLQKSEIGPNMKWVKTVNKFGEYFGTLGNDSSKFYIYTNEQGSSNYKIVTYDFEKPEQVGLFLTISTFLP